MPNHDTPISSKSEAGTGTSNLTLILLNVCVGQLVVGVDQRALFVALPTLARSYETSLLTIQWAILIYDLVLVGLVITLGQLGDLFGRRKFYVAGFSLFALGSLLCGVSQSVAQLIAFRALQAVGGTLIAANGRAIVSVAFPVVQRGRALGFVAMAFRLGFIIGPLCGGLLIDAASWRWIFFINLPICVWGVYLARRVVKETRDSNKTRSIDFVGAILLLLSTTLLMLGMNEIPEAGWTHPTVMATIAASLLAAAVLVVVELRSPAPVLRVSLFRERLFSVAMFSLFLLALSQGAVGYLMPFYLQDIKGLSASDMGWIMIVGSIGVVAAPLAGWLSDRVDARILCTLGAGLVVVGQFFIASLHAGSSVVTIIWIMALFGLGWGFFISPNQNAMLGAVPDHHAGSAIGMNATAQRMGRSFGISASSILFLAGFASAGLGGAALDSTASWRAAPDAFVRSFNHAIHITNIAAVLAVVFSLVRGPRAKRSGQNTRSGA